jgi:hypothetical protein
MVGLLDAVASEVEAGRQSPKRIRRFENRDVVASFDQPLGRCQTCQASANDAEFPLAHRKAHVDPGIG